MSCHDYTSPKGSSVDNKTSPKTQTLETKQLTELLALIYLALKNIQLYPARHPLVKSRLLAAHQMLAQILTTKKTLLFGIARNVFTFNGQPLGEESQACTTFAKILSRHEVALLHFSYGISQHSLYLFLQAAGILPDQKQSGENTQQELSTLSLPHVAIETINYNYLDRRDNTNQAPIRNDGGSLTWLSFTQKLTSGILGYTGDSTATTSQGSTLVSPEALAAAINREASKHPVILKQFSTLLDQMLSQSPSSFGGQELSRIITSLNPELREQFLNTTLERCDHNLEQNNPEKILDQFSDSVVLDMIQQINKKNVSVSPGLVNLISKLSKTRFTSDSTTAAAVTRQREISNFPGSESYNKHVGPRYHNSLQKLANAPSVPNPPPANFPLNEYLATLAEEHVNRQIVRAILILMEQSDNEKEYADLAEQLMELCLILPDSGAYDLLQVTAKTLQKQATEKKSATIHTIVDRCLQQLTALDFLEYVYSMLPDASDKERVDATDLFKLFCPDIIDKLLKIFCIKPQVSEDDPLFSIFMTFRLETLTTIFTILPKSSSNIIRKLLILIDYLGTQGTVRLLHPLLDNEDWDIRIQVLNLLLPTHDEEAIATLISMLDSENSHTVDAAIGLCSTHKPSACVPALLNLIEYQFVKQTTIERNRKLFMVLSHIGDPKALPCLEKVAFTMWPFHREQITTMKRILFYSLKGYRDEDRNELVQRGMEVKDEEIRKICNALLPPRLRDRNEK